MAAIRTREAAYARITALAKAEISVHPEANYLKPSLAHTITERHREKVVKWINGLSAPALPGPPPSRPRAPHTPPRPAPTRIGGSRGARPPSPSPARARLRVP